MSSFEGVVFGGEKYPFEYGPCNCFKYPYFFKEGDFVSKLIVLEVSSEGIVEYVHV